MKTRFHTLDAMRGVSAIIVVLLHAGLIMPRGPLQDGAFYILRHAYLAVDFFFMLSGFVLARAYEHKLKASMTVGQFIEMRLVRLYPMFLIGILFGVALMGGRILFHSQHAISIAGALAAFVMNLLMLPSFSSLNLFPYNEPAWSLFFELAINIALGLVLFRFSSRRLAALCGVMGTVFLAGIIYGNTADVGWNWINISIGICRVGFGFPLGILLGRLYGGRPTKHSSFSLLLIGALATVLFADAGRNYHWAYDIVAIFVVMPTILWLGANNDLPFGFEKSGAILGDISYPLYAIHYPLLQISANLMVRKFHFTAVAATAVFVIGVIALSWVFAIYLDAPIRKWISNRLRLRVTAMPTELV